MRLQLCGPNVVPSYSLLLLNLFQGLGSVRILWRAHKNSSKFHRNRMNGKQRIREGGGDERNRDSMLNKPSILLRIYGHVDP